jgi:hypothetical protein
VSKLAQLQGHFTQFASRIKAKENTAKEKAAGCEADRRLFWILVVIGGLEPPTPAL